MANLKFVPNKVPLMDAEINYNYQPAINKSSVKLVDKMKEKGTFGQTAIEHMCAVDIESRKVK
mgnify:CR=1 FL=1